MLLSIICVSGRIRVRGSVLLCTVVYMYVLLCVCELGKFTRWVKSLFIRTNQCHIALKLHLIWVQCSSTPYNI